MTTTSATTSSLTGSASSSAMNQLQSMNADTFMQMFTTELANQNPMDPMDDSQMLNQFSQITQVQSTSQLTQSMGAFQNTLSSLLSASNANQGIGLLGKTVQYTDANGNNASGVVSAMGIAPDGSVKLNIGGTPVDLGSVTQVN